ncbi:MAG: hypothetical protein IKH34_02945 [Oscillospiraceae bacterium]|nr:hypothetical protein [Oscillospiraceae bacterium]
MKKAWKQILCISLCLAFFFGMLSKPDALAEETVLTEERQNAVAMINYLAVMTQEVNKSPGNRLLLEDNYSLLLNNISSRAIDDNTMSQIINLLDVMEQYRMLAVKRNRLQFCAEQEQALLMNSAIKQSTNGADLLDLILSLGSPTCVLSELADLAGITMNSCSEFYSDDSIRGIEGLKEGWELDDEAAEALHSCRKSMFEYQSTMAREYGIPDEWILNEKEVDAFVAWKKDPSPEVRIQYFESHRNTYQHFGGYWLELAKSYYETGDYVNCINAIEEYEALGIHVFQRDYELAETLPFIIAAADSVFTGEEYNTFVERLSQVILDNTDDENWALRYFAAQTYIDLFARTSDEQYLRRAMDIAVINTTLLAKEQRMLNEEYLMEVQLVSIPKDATSAEKKEIKAYNEMLETTRETELSPVSEPLLLNCEMLFSLAKALKLTDSEKARIDAFLHPNGVPLFLVEAMDARFWMNSSKECSVIPSAEISYRANLVEIPVMLVCQNTEIRVRVYEQGKSRPVELTDWELKEVIRTEGEWPAFSALYYSKRADSIEWVPDLQIMIDVRSEAGQERSYHFEWKTESTKQSWYNYLMPWQGHASSWYDRLQPWKDLPDFVPVE